MKKNMKTFIAAILATSLLTATVGAIEVSPDTAPALDSYTLAQLPQNIRVSLTEQDQIVSVQKDDDPFSITVNNQDGSKTATVFSVPVKYETTDGKMELIDTSIVSNSVLNNLFQGYQYKNKANAFTAEFSTSAEKGIRLTSEGNSITMAPAVADTASVMTNTATAAITAAVEEAATDDAFVYENVFGAGTRVKYYNTSLGIKEDIILDYNIGKNRFDFEIDTGGDIPILTEDAAMILVYDKDDPEQLNYRFGTLYAYDSYVGGASESGFRHLTEECYYELTPIEGSKYRITVVVPEEWLDHPELVYPVTIDPSISATSSPTNIDDTYVRETHSNKNYYLEVRLRIGNYNDLDYTDGKCYSYVRFITLPSLTNATVTQATLKMSLLSGQTSAQPARTWRVTASWSGSTATWNNKPSNSESSPITSPVGVSHYNFEVGAIVNSWYNGASNYGFLINYSNQNYADLNSLYSSDCGISTKLPTLTITYATNYAPITNGTYFIRNQKSGHYLDAFNAGGSGANVCQYKFRGGGNQQWVITHKGGGYYQIVPGHNSNLSLDVSNGGGANGTNVQVYNHTVYSAQRWKIIANANGTYRIASKCSNDTRVLTVANASTESNANVIQHQYNGSGNDEWILIPTTVPQNEYCFEMSIFAGTEPAYVSGLAGGHAFLLFKNISSQYIQFGPIFLKPGEEMTLTKWRYEKEGVNIHFGIWYNLDTVILDEDLRDYVYITEQIKGSALTYIEDYCRNHDSYLLAFDNCCTLSIAIWNHLATNQVDASLGDNPIQLYNYISNTYNESTGRTIPLASEIGYRNTTYHFMKQEFNEKGAF